MPQPTLLGGMAGVARARGFEVGVRKSVRESSLVVTEREGTSGHSGLELIVGSMFTGKSEELIRRVKRAIIARGAVQVFKPALDDRYGAEIVRSHDGDSFVATPLRSVSEILNLVAPDTSVVAIDEAQVFGPRWPTSCAGSSPPAGASSAPGST